MSEKGARIIIAGGGTGGHLFPGIAIAEEFLKRGKADILFVGAGRSLEKDVLGVLIYGSYAKKETTPRSDIDICIVIGSLSSPGEMRKLLSIVWRNVNINKKNYDVKIFEELPLHIKIEVIEDGKVIIGKKPEIYEYFYKFRKMWNDQKHRQKL